MTRSQAEPERDHDTVLDQSPQRCRKLREQETWDARRSFTCITRAKKEEIMPTPSKVEPFAFTLLLRSKDGATVTDISRETGIPVDRITMRLRAAECYLSQSSLPWNHNCAPVWYEE